MLALARLGRRRVMNGLDAETLSMTLDAIRDFTAARLPDQVLLDLDARDECPVDVVRAMCGEELGIQLLFIPEEYGGMGGNSFDVYRVCELLARVDLGVATSLFATFLGSDPITVGATPEQKKEWLTRIAEEGLLFAYGATEPAAGSDLGALKTTAQPVIEEGVTVAYRISGQKQWISNGGLADAYTILANTPGGPSWFVVDRGVPGFTNGKPEDKHGIRASNTAALFLDDVEVDLDRLVGGVEGQGLQQAQAVFGSTRLMVAAFGHHQAREAEHGLGLLEPLPLPPADQPVEVHLHVVEEQRGGVAGADAVLVLGLAVREPGDAAVHHEPRGPARRVRQDRVRVGQPAVRDPLLLPADPVGDGDALLDDRQRGGLQRAEVASGGRLGGPVREQEPRLGDLGQPLLLLLWRRPDGDGVAAEERGEQRSGHAEIHAGEQLAHAIHVE